MPILHSIQQTISLLQNGQLIAVPTETVYGLAAPIDSPISVRQIFAQKGRPVDHPLIIHVSSLEMAEQYGYFSATAKQIAKHFWPGPLTIIVPKKDTVIAEVTGNLDTVAIRMPNHPMMLDIIKTLNIPLAAPSANKFGKISPTMAQHVIDDFADTVSVLDGGECAIGIESTILDMSEELPCIRRFGQITEIDLLPFIQTFGQTETKTSGTHKAHYAPSTSLLLSDDIESDRILYQDLGLSVAILAPQNNEDYAKTLYAELRRLDTLGVDILIAAKPILEGIGLAVLDRLSRASAGSNQHRFS